MTDKKVYAVSDLAAELGVPRTTLNDWLKRFDRYLESGMNGKRRVYTANALEVLRAVNNMRNDGYPAAKIEVELSGRFAVSADEISDFSAENGGDDKVNDGKVQIVKPKSDGSGNPSLPALCNGELERFANLAEELASIGRSRRRTTNITLVILLVISVFSIAGAWYMVQLLKLQAANRALINEMAEKNEAYRKAEQKRIAELADHSAERDRKLNIIRMQMDKDRTKLEKSISAENKRLQGTLMRMQKAHELSNRELAVRYRKEISMLQEMLRDTRKLLVEKDKQKTDAQREVIKLQHRISELEKSLRTLKSSVATVPAVPEKSAPARETVAPDRETTEKKAAVSGDVN